MIRVSSPSAVVTVAHSWRLRFAAKLTFPGWSAVMRMTIA